MDCNDDYETAEICHTNPMTGVTSRLNYKVMKNTRYLRLCELDDEDNLNFLCCFYHHGMCVKHMQKLKSIYDRAICCDECTTPKQVKEI